MTAYQTQARPPIASERAPLSQVWPAFADHISVLFSSGSVFFLALFAGYIRLVGPPFSHKISLFVGRDKPYVKLALDDALLLDVARTETAPLASSPLSPKAIETRESGVLRNDVHRMKLHHGSFRSVAIDVFHSTLLQLRNTKWKRASEAQVPFTRQEQLPYLGRVPDEEVADVWDSVLLQVFSRAQDMQTRKEGQAIGLRVLAAQTVADTLSALDFVESFLLNALSGLEGLDNSIKVVHHGWAANLHSSPARDGLRDRRSPYFTFTNCILPERLLVDWPARFSEDFLPAVVQVAQALRDDKRHPTFTELIAFHIAYHLLGQGRLSLCLADARFLGTVGFRRDAQTYVSLTDPGEGHIFGTTRKSRWMRGAIVHVEHLERPQNLPRKLIESYRIPSILDFARTRLHTGMEAPNTYFVGRALKDSCSGSFEHDFIKIVNITSAAATAAFQLGAAECKVSMDGLTTSQMIAYMRALSAHALRHHRQYLSAAFNLNHPVVDNLRPRTDDGDMRVLSDRMDIGRRGVELAALGGFDKVTWDGAADSYPSQCIILQLGFQNALELVHRAHSVGLVTYMSAGFKFHNIADAVLTGVDGIGIGGAQILRHMDGVSGMHGPYMEENIDRIIKARDDAEHTTRGRGALLLARLDQMHFEGSLAAAEEALREPLYVALYDINESRIQHLISSDAARNVLSISIDGEQPWMGRARRILRTSEPLLRTSVDALDDGDALWETFIRGLQCLIREEDEEGLYSYSLCGAWKELRAAYRKVIREGRPVQGEIRVGLKVAPYGG